MYLNGGQSVAQPPWVESGLSLMLLPYTTTPTTTNTTTSTTYATTKTISTTLQILPTLLLLRVLFIIQPLLLHLLNITPTPTNCD